MVAIPGFVKVGPFIFSLFGDDRNFKRISRPFEKEDLGDCIVKGITDNLTCEIAVNPIVGEANRPETIMHEVLHAAWYACQLGQMENVCDMEEEVVAHLSPMLLMVLRDNPDLMSYLTSQKPLPKSRAASTIPTKRTRKY